MIFLCITAAYSLGCNCVMKLLNILLKSRETWNRHYRDFIWWTSSTLTSSPKTFSLVLPGRSTFLLIMAYPTSSTPKGARSNTWTSEDRCNIALTRWRIHSKKANPMLMSMPTMIMGSKCLFNRWNSQPISSSQLKCWLTYNINTCTP